MKRLQNFPRRFSFQPSSHYLQISKQIAKRNELVYQQKYT